MSFRLRSPNSFCLFNQPPSFLDAIHFSSSFSAFFKFGVFTCALEVAFLFFSFYRLITLLFFPKNALISLSLSRLEFFSLINFLRSNCDQHFLSISFTFALLAVKEGLRRIEQAKFIINRNILLFSFVKTRTLTASSC